STVAPRKPSPETLRVGIGSSPIPSPASLNRLTGTNPPNPYDDYLSHAMSTADSPLVACQCEDAMPTTPSTGLGAVQPPARMLVEVSYSRRNYSPLSLSRVPTSRSC